MIIIMTKQCWNGRIQKSTESKRPYLDNVIKCIGGVKVYMVIIYSSSMYILDVVFIAL